MHRFEISTLVLLLFIAPISSFANDLMPSPLADKYTFSNAQYPGTLIAEDSDDTYDPFSDYSEFDDASDEEADVHFFRNGRFVTIGFAVGVRNFTDNLAKLYSSGSTYGLSLSYFFDMRLAFEIGFKTGDYGFELMTPTEKLTGNVSLTFINMSLKYYFNTQNVTKGLADLNPYILGGFSQVYRTYTMSGVDGFGRDATVGADMGVGIEIPMMRRKAFFGIQATYHYVNFKDESNFITLPSGTQTTAKPAGDTYDVLGIIGLNY